jgi:hypothetical protein
MEAAEAFAGQSGGPTPLLCRASRKMLRRAIATRPTESRSKRSRWARRSDGPKNQGPLKPKALEAATIAYAKTGKMPAGMGGQQVRNQILNYLPTVMDRYGLTPDDIPSIQQQFQADAKAYIQAAHRPALLHAQQSLGKLNQHAQDLSALVKAIPLQDEFHAIQLDHPKSRGHGQQFDP